MMEFKNTYYELMTCFMNSVSTNRPIYDILYTEVTLLFLKRLPIVLFL